MSIYELNNMKGIEVIMNKKGFTLVELLAIIVILGILASITTATVGNYIKKSKFKNMNTILEFSKFLSLHLPFSFVYCLCSFLSILLNRNSQFRVS